MRLSVILICALLCFGRSGDLELIKATTQEWTSGKQGISGTKYHFMLKTKISSEKLTVERLWVGKESAKCRVFKFGGNMQDKVFEAGDTIMITAEIVKTPEKESDMKPPYKYKGAALITYKKGKKQKYLEIDSFEKLKSLKYH